MTNKDLRRERFSLKKQNLILKQKLSGLVKGSTEYNDILFQISQNKLRIKDINSKLKYSIYGLRVLNSCGFITIIIMLAHIIKLLNK